jgi:N-acetylglutamate synthase-like GNAT family acetyltransferase
MQPSSSVTDIHLRLAGVRDVERIVHCIDDAYSIYASRIRDLPDVTADVPAAIENSRVWIAEQNKQVVGCIILVPEPGVLHLQNIAVRTKSAGMGIGRMLIERSEADCREFGLHEIRLSTHVDMPENVAIYSHLGWRETGRSGSKVHMSKTI